MEDALHKTEQFKPATAFEEPKEIVLVDPFNEDEIFDVLAKREDKVSRYWFPNYGRELFKTRILPDLENRGVKMFKRLYFEV